MRYYIPKMPLWGIQLLVVFYQYLVPVVIIVNILDNHPAHHAREKGGKIKEINIPGNAQNYEPHDPVVKVKLPLAHVNEDGFHFAAFQKHVAKCPAKQI